MKNPEHLYGLGSSRQSLLIARAAAPLLLLVLLIQSTMIGSVNASNDWQELNPVVPLNPAAPQDAASCGNKGRQNHLGLYNARNSWLGFQPDCYQFSYTIRMVGEEDDDAPSIPLEPTTNRVAYRCPVDSTTPPIALYAPALQTVTDVYNFAMDRCVCSSENNDETTPATELPDCQITYKTLTKAFRDPIWGFSLGVMEYEIPESIRIPMTNQQQQGDDDETAVFSLDISDFQYLNCDQEDMAAVPDDKKCTGAAGDDFKVPVNKEWPLAGGMCHNWRDVALGLLQAKASWNRWKPDCYEFGFRKTIGSTAVEEATHRVAFGRAVDDETGQAVVQEKKAAVTDAPMNTITDLYDYAVETCIDSCPTWGAYECDIQYRQLMASTATASNGGFGAMFPFDIPVTIRVDMDQGLRNDEVTYQMTDYRVLSCDAEGLVKEGDGNDVSEGRDEDEDGKDVTPQGDLTPVNPVPEDPPVSLPSGEICHDWEQVLSELTEAKASWIKGAPDCYQFHVVGREEWRTSQRTHRVAFGRAIEDEEPRWPVIATITRWYDYAIQTCTGGCPDMGPYKCEVDYTTVTAPKQEVGSPNEMVSFQIPSRISVDRYQRWVDDEVSYEISDFEPLDCAAEGMGREDRPLNEDDGPYACDKGRSNHLGLYNARNRWVGFQPDCYRFSYTADLLMTEAERPSSLPVVNRVANRCPVDTTLPSDDAIYTPSIQTITDLYDFAMDQCVGSCTDDETTPTGELPDCQVSYRTLSKMTRDPETGISWGVLEYEIPEWINITSTNGKAEHKLVFHVPKFEDLDCDNEEGIVQDGMKDCGDGAREPAEKEWPSGEVCHNWRDLTLELLQAKASWGNWKPDCYEFSYSKTIGSSTPTEATHRVAFDRAVDENGAIVEKKAVEGSILIDTITDLYDYAVETCTASCPESGAYECEVTYRELTASTATPENGFGALFPFSIPASIHVNMLDGFVNDDVLYRITGYRALNCEAEGMVGKDVGEDGNDEEENDDEEDDMSSADDPVPLPPIIMLPFGGKCHNWEEVSSGLKSANASWTEGQPDCYQFSVFGASMTRSPQLTHRVAFGRAVKDDGVRAPWPTIDTITGWYEYANETCTANCPDSGPYRCALEYTTVTLPKATGENEMVSFQIPSRIVIDWMQGVIDDEVLYEISDFEPLDCEAEGMKRDSGEQDGNKEDTVHKNAASQAPP